MAFDKRNGPIVRTALILPTSSPSDIQLGDAGIWHDSTGPKTKLRIADGTDRGLMRAEGVVPAARCAFSANPSNGDTLTINSSTFTFKTSLVTATTTTQVKIGASAAVTLASLLNAINGVADVTVVKNTTPFALPIVADAVSATVLRIRLALAQGGAATAGVSGSYALAASITAGASAWSAANLNVSGKSAIDCRVSMFEVAVTAAMVTNASFQLELPFTPTSFSAFVTSSAGVQRASTDAITISGNAINVALAGGASPAIQAGDLVRVWAIE